MCVVVWRTILKSVTHTFLYICSNGLNVKQIDVDIFVQYISYFVHGQLNFCLHFFTVLQRACSCDIWFKFHPVELRPIIK